MDGLTSKEEPGAWAIGFDLDSYMGISDTTYGGVNTLSSTFSPMFTFGTPLAADKQLSVLHIGMFDAVVSCDTASGILSVAS